MHFGVVLALAFGAFLVGVEVFIVAEFFPARHAYHVDIAGPCRDECLPTWFDMIVWGALIFV